MAHCTFALRDCVQCYNSHDTDVQLISLDAAKAFDTVEYIQLCTLLLDSGIHPVLARIFLNMYTRQHMIITWYNDVADSFSSTNGVQQGGILSTILFVSYIEELLKHLKHLVLVAILVTSFQIRLHMLMMYCC